MAAAPLRVSEAEVPLSTPTRPPSMAASEMTPGGDRRRSPRALPAPPGPAILVGLIGAAIQASRTPAMHEQEAVHHGLRYVYRLIDLDRLGLSASALDELVLAAERLGFAGLNITHPCKQAATRLVGSLSPDADAIGAINTIVFEDGHRIGHNTDCSGFVESFRCELPEVSRHRVVLLGAGGAGSAVGHALLQVGAGSIAVFDTAPDRAAALATQLEARHGRGRARAVEDLRSCCGRRTAWSTQRPWGWRSIRECRSLLTFCAQSCGLPTSCISPSAPNCSTAQSNAAAAS